MPKENPGKQRPNMFQEILERLGNGLFKDEGERKDYEAFARLCTDYQNAFKKVATVLLKDPSDESIRTKNAAPLRRATCALFEAATGFLEDVAQMTNDSDMLRHSCLRFMDTADEMDKSNGVEPPRKPPITGRN